MTNPIKPDSPRWRELVKEGIARDGNRNWFLGDAALEIAPMGDRTGPNGTDVAAHLERYADEVGVAVNSLTTYRQVAAAWPLETRVSNTSWKVHEQLKSRQELIKPGMTVTQAHAVLGHSNTGRTGPEAPAEQRAKAVAELLEDPDVAERVVANRQVRQNIDAARQVVAERGAIDRGIRPMPKSAEEQADEAMFPVMFELKRAIETLRKAHRLITPDLTPEDREALAKAIPQIRAWADLLEQALSGDEAIDTALIALLEEGAL